MKDIMIDENMEILSDNGDFVVGESEQQHVELIIKSHKGDWKEFPLLGFGVDRYLKSPTSNRKEFIRDLIVELQYDGFRNPEVLFTNDGLEVNV